MDMRALAGIRVLDVDGTPRQLAEQWRDQTAVLVWLRHFGCIYCREAARELLTVQHELAQSRAALVLIGNGGPRQAREFQRHYAPGVTVLTDPALDSYRAIGARRGILRTVGPQTWGHAVRALSRGARQGAVKGHPFQQGGVVVMTPEQHAVYVYLSSSAGDHPPVRDVVEAVRRAAAGAVVDTGAARRHAAAG